MESDLINILCYKLSGDLSRAVYNEYENRLNEIKQIWEYPQNRFIVLAPYSKTIQHLLAISTFYRRVLSGMDGACDFYKTVNKCKDKSESAIAIGKYRLDKSEYNKLLAIQISFNKLRDKFGIDEQLFNYTETEEFLTNCKNIFYRFYVRQFPETSGHKTDEDFPF